jgi:uncharacterized RDD family membrane protein YckC
MMSAMASPTFDVAEFSRLIRQALWMNGLAFVAQASYFIWFYSTSGQTIGKRVMKLRVAGIDGAPLNWRKGVLRYLGSLISSFTFSIGYLWALFDYDKQTWHDKNAGTIVIDDSAGPLQPRLTAAAAWERQWRWLLLVGAVGLLLFAYIISTAINTFDMFSRAFEALPTPRP